MGLCVSVQKSSEASPMKVGLSFESKTEKHTIPPSPVKEKQANGNRPVKSQSPSTVKDFGNKEDTFFDSQAWLDSDCEDDFYSVNGDFTPSRGNTPVHHSFSRGTTPVHKALVSRTPSPLPEPSPTGAKKKLLELFKESIGEDPDFDGQHTSGNQNIANGKPEVKSTILDLPPKSANGTPIVSRANSVSGSGSTAKGDDTKGMEKPIRGNTPVHHSFSRGTTPVHEPLVSRTPSPLPEPSPTGAKKKLLELFKESTGEDPDFDGQHTSGNQNIANGKPEVKLTILDLPPKSANGTTIVSRANSVSSSGSTAKGGDDTKGMEKPIRASPCCLPSLVSHRGRGR